MERSPADHASASELPALLIKGPREVALITRDQEAFSTPDAGPSGRCDGDPEWCRNQKT